MSINLTSNLVVIESVALVGPIGHMGNGWTEKSFLEQPSQLFGQCDFGIARVTRGWVHARVPVVQLNLRHEHSGRISHAKNTNVF